MNSFRTPFRPLVLSASLVLAVGTMADGLRAESEPHAESPSAEKSPASEPALKPTEKAESSHEESPHAASTAAAGKSHLFTASESPSQAKEPHVPLTADQAASLIKLGKSLTDRGDYVAAEIAYHQVLFAPDAPIEDTKTALIGLAHMHRKQGTNLTKAAAIYEKYLKEYPGDDRSPEVLLSLGRTLRSMGAYKLAISRFYSVINSTLKVSGGGFDRYQLLARTAQFEIAETHFESGNYVEASKFFTRLRLLELAPVDRARAHFKAAYSLHLGGNIEGAVAGLRAFLEQWPDDENSPEARYLLALDLRATKRNQEALNVTLDLLRTEKNRGTTDPKVWLYWQRRTGNQLANDFFEGGDIANAHAIYMGLATLSPELAWKLPLHYQIGLCRERLGDLDGAKSIYQSIIDGAGVTPPATLSELVRMAAWRIEHLAWRNDVGQRVTVFFETKTGHMTPAAPSMPVIAKTSAQP